MFNAGKRQEPGHCILYFKGSNKKEKKSVRSIIALTEKASQSFFQSHLPIMFASRVSFLRSLHAWIPFFWKYAEQFV